MIKDLFDPMQLQMEKLLKSRAIWKGQDDKKATAIKEKQKEIEETSAELNVYVEKVLSPLLVCLMEQSFMQIASEE